MAYETPGQILHDLRDSLRLSRYKFAQRVGRGWTEHIVRNYEDARTPLTHDQLGDLLAAGIVKEGDEYHRRFVEAIRHQEAEELKRAERTPTNPDHPVEPRKPTKTIPKSCFLIAAVMVIVGLGVIAVVVTLLGGDDWKRQLPGVDATVSAIAAQTEVARAVKETIAALSVQGTTIASEENVSGLQTESAPYSTDTPLPTYTPQQPYPTNTVLPTYTPVAEPPSPVPAPAIPTLFEDSFDAGIKPEWQVISGEWRAVNDSLTTLSRETEWSYVLVGSPDWQGYAVEVLYDDANLYDEIRILVRVQDRNNMMAFDVQSGSYSHTEWLIMKNGEWQLLVNDVSVRDRPARIRVEVKGNSYIAYANGERVSSISDPTFSNGSVGLAIHCQSSRNCAWFDDFKVFELE